MDVARGHVRPPVAEPRRRRPHQALLVRLARDVDVAGVVEHSGLEHEADVIADLAQRLLRLDDELLVAKLHAARADTPPQLARGVDLRSPLAGEAGSIARMSPGARDDAVRHLGEGQRTVAAVADQMDVERRGKEPLQQGKALHVHRRLVSPALLAARRGVRLVDRADRLAGRLAGAEPRTHRLDVDVPLAQRRQPPKIVHERVDVDRATVAIRELRNEVGLVGHGKPRVAVEHHAQQRRPRATHAEHEDRRQDHDLRTKTRPRAVWPPAVATRT